MRPISRETSSGRTRSRTRCRVPESTVQSCFRMETFIVDFCADSAAPLTNPNFASLPCMIREIDLAGNTVRQMSIAQVNTALAANGFAGLVLATMHHDRHPATERSCPGDGQHPEKCCPERSNDADPGSRRRGCRSRSELESSLGLE